VIAILDYEAGNLTSVLRAIKHLGYDGEITDDERMTILQVAAELGFTRSQLTMAGAFQEA